MQVMIPHNLAPGQPLLVTLPGGGQMQVMRRAADRRADCTPGLHA